AFLENRRIIYSRILFGINMPQPPCQITGHHRNWRNPGNAENRIQQRAIFCPQTLDFGLKRPCIPCG
ncbi:MAG: hypothetical protein WA175_10560, partial [Candidatus Acidiferrales bacterium]